MTKLMKHVAHMQGRATEFLTPGPYTDQAGVSHAEGHDAADAFVGDMIYNLDGPEQREAQFDYLALSARTASGEFHGELISRYMFINSLSNFINAANDLDRYKKLAFYGEDETKGRVGDLKFAGESDGHTLIDEIAGQVVIDRPMSKIDIEEILHSVLGVASEAGEMVEAIMKALNHQALDLTNLSEESGDAKWYLAMLARKLGVEWDHDERVNIAKLQKRFPGKFTQEAANNRDLAAERAVLEAGTSEDRSVALMQMSIAEISNLPPGAKTFDELEGRGNSALDERAEVVAKAEAALAAAEHPLGKI